MRKFRRTMYIITGFFGFLAFVGVLLAILSGEDLATKILNIINLCISSGSIIIAIISQIDADRSRRNSERLARELSAMSGDIEDSKDIDKSLPYKLEKISAQNEAIYIKLGGNLDELREDTASSGREAALKRKKLKLQK